MTVLRSRPTSPVHRRAARLLAIAAACGLAAAALSTSPGAAQTTAPPAAAESSALQLPASRFVPITPARVLDTRPGESPNRGQARLADQTALSVDPLGTSAVLDQLAALSINPSSVTAVVANITAVDAGGGGFSTLWPTGFERPFVSTNNPQFSGDTTANLTITPLGLDRKLSIYTSESADYIVDVMGVMVSSGATRSGRFVSLGPIRHSDTRSPSAHTAGQTRHPGGQVRTVDLKPGGVPSSASAVVLNVTADDPSTGGFVTISPGGVGAGPALEYSNVNLAPGEARSNQVIVGVTNGTIDVYTHAATDIIIDISGYFTGPSASPSTAGLFVPITPGRLLDSREPIGDTGLTGGARIAANTPFVLKVAGRLGGSLPAAGIQAVALNVTAVFPAAGGFIKSYPNGGSTPPTSSVNYNRAGDIVPNQAITTLGSGSVRLLSSQPTHIVVDATGYFLTSDGTLPSGGVPTKTIRMSGLDPAQLNGTSRPSSAPYDFLFDRGVLLSTGTRPFPTQRVAWDACKPLRYALNVDLANDAQIEVLIASIEEMELRSGIDFQYGGVTSAGLNISDEIILAESFGTPFKYLPPADGGGDVDLVIGYSDAAQTSQLAGSVIGVGGSLRTGFDGSGRARAARGFAIIDLPDLAGTTNETRKLTATTTHELGHMMGLGHVDEGSPERQGLEEPTPARPMGSWDVPTLRAQLMYPSLKAGLTDEDTKFSAGDRLGLWELYNSSEQPCGTTFRLAQDDRPLVAVEMILDEG